MKQILLSQIGSAAEFAAALELHRAGLEAHRLGEPDQVAPIAHELLDSLVLRVPDPSTGPVEERAPDQFVIAPYEIVDDTPAPPAAPSLADRKRDLLVQLELAARDAANEFLSPGRARLVSIEARDAMAFPEGKRSAAHAGAIELYSSYCSRLADIERVVARAAVAIEDLTEATIGSWAAPAFN